MGKPLDLTGQKFGMLTATECLGSIKGRRYWAVKCDCGNENLVPAMRLKGGGCTSCGCARNQPVHGHTVNSKATPEYQIWSQLKSNSNQPYIAEWNDFKSFIKDVGKRPSIQHRLKRRDVTKPHGPTNTYWRNKDEDERLRNLTHQDLGDGFFIDMRAIARANYAAKERERATA